MKKPSNNNLIAALFIQFSLVLCINGCTEPAIEKQPAEVDQEGGTQTQALASPSASLTPNPMATESLTSPLPMPSVLSQNDLPPATAPLASPSNPDPAIIDKAVNDAKELDNIVKPQDNPSSVSENTNSNPPSLDELEKKLSNIQSKIDKTQNKAKTKLNERDSDHNRANGLKTIHFPFNSFMLTETAQETLKFNGAILSKQKTIIIRVDGHTDKSGTWKYNKKLGLKRAEAVKIYLKGLGVQAKRIKIRSRGGARLINHHRSKKANAANRRANFIIISD